MHTTFYKAIKENYKKLVANIQNTFQLDSSQNLLFIEVKTYGNNDCFYQAKGKYNLFHTCNSWANKMLKNANQKAVFWTVTDSGIFCHYQ